MAKPVVEHEARGRTDLLTMHEWKYGRKFSVANLHNPPKHELALATKQVTLTHTIIAGDFNTKTPS